ncbi:coiled-coil domain-containing protein 32 [Protopterus annectens]|uniref:coiled-coil domain-containing protein 32 n=1 Tax=Protopterus annectens TaxID=7888 RepID=UPI001CFB0A7B|nr:coiled-coil domain-containing protein 32 [Protopterus annectens]
MIDCIESVATRAGQDLWAEVCSHLPSSNQGGVHGDIADGFSDAFTDLCSIGPELYRNEAAENLNHINHSSVCSPKPWAPMEDSEIYLASLERKLKRLRGQCEEVTSRDILCSLAQARKECWDRFLQEKFESEVYVDGHDSDESTLDQLKRWLQPDRVAINTEELQYLILPDNMKENGEPSVTTETDETEVTSQLD